MTPKQIIDALIAKGYTMYGIAKQLRISRATIGRIASEKQLDTSSTNLRKLEQLLDTVA